MFIAPLIEIGIKTVSQTTFRYIVIAALVYTYFAQALCAANSHDAVFLLTIYLAARYFKLHMVDKSAQWRWEKYIGILAILLLMIIPVLASKAHLPMMFFNLFVQNNNPVVFCPALIKILRSFRYFFNKHLIGLVETLSIVL